MNLHETCNSYVDFPLKGMKIINIWEMYSFFWKTVQRIDKEAMHDKAC